MKSVRVFSGGPFVDLFVELCLDPLPLRSKDTNS